ncbi:MAG: hypothetical protein JNL82_19490 [Myxococcales bacterium]|nr:hypothetical protein [Myxococcales bacterium]
MGNPFGPTHNSRREVDASLVRRASDERDAAGTFAALRAQIESIEEAPGMNVAVGVPFGNEVLYVQQLGYEGRNTIFMVCERGGTRVRLVMHHSQLQVMLVPVAQESEKPAKVLYMVPTPKDAPDEE